MSFDKDTVLRIVQDTDIVDVVSDYVTLKKAGKNHKGLCPFHQEKTPSFVVSPEKQIFHCFGCHEGGDVLTFLIKVEHLEFPLAVRMLAERLGIELEDTRNNNVVSKDSKEEFFDINKRVASFYHRYLLQAKEAEPVREYLSRRGISVEVMKEFMLGMAPNAYGFLVNTATKKRINLELLDKMGLVRQYEPKKYSDWFRNRVMFPITDVKGKVIAFGGRVLDDSLPKYINSPETVLFKKSSTLYGLNKALPFVRENDSIIILEGYMDVIGLSKEGVKNVVATLGTALTLEHISKIRRYTKNVIMIFDGDNAGVKASMRTIELFVNSGMNIKIVSLPDGLDPDDYVNTFGPKKLNEELLNAEDGFKFLINKLSELEDASTLEGKKNICDTVLPLAAKMENRLEQNYVVRLVSESLGESEEDIKYELKRFTDKLKRRKSFNSRDEKVKNNVSKIVELKKVEEDFLTWVIYNIRRIEEVKKMVKPEWITSKAICKILNWLFENSKSVVSKNVNVIINLMRYEFKDDGILNLLSRICLDDKPEAVVQGKLGDYTNILKRDYMELRIKVLEQELSKSNFLNKEKIVEYENLIKKMKKI